MGGVETYLLHHIHLSIINLQREHFIEQLAHAVSRLFLQRLRALGFKLYGSEAASSAEIPILMVAATRS